MEGGRVIWYFDGDASNFYRTVDKVNSTIASLQGNLKNAEKAGKDSLGNLTKETESLSKATGGASGVLSSFGAGLSSVGRFAAQTASTMATLGISAATALSVFAVPPLVQYAGALELTDMSFKAMLRSVEAGGKLFNDIYKYSQKSPFPLQDLTRVSQYFLAANKSGDETLEILKDLADVAGATGANLKGFGYVTSQVFGAGRAYGNDFFQLVNSGATAILPELSRLLKITDGNIKEAFGDGRITAELWAEALSNMAEEGGVAFKGNERAAQTLAGLMDNIVDATKNAGLAMLGLGIEAEGVVIRTGGPIDRLKIALNGLIEYFSSPAFQEFAVNFGEAINSLLTGIEKLGVALLPLAGLGLGFMGPFLTHLPIIGELFKGLTGPVGLVAGLIAGMVATSPELRSALGEAFTKVAEVLTPQLATIADALAKTLPILAGALASVFEAFSKLPSWAQTAIVDIVLALLLLSKLGIPLGKVASSLGGIFKIFGGAGGKVFGLLGKIPGVSKAAGGVSAGVGKGIGAFFEAIFKPLASSTVLRGAASAALIGAAIFLIALGLGKASSTEIDFGNLGRMALAFVGVTAIFSLLSFIAGYAAVGAIAAAVISGSLYLSALGLASASAVAENIDIGNLARLVAAIAIVSGAMALISVIAVIGAVGSVGSAITGLGLAVAAIGLSLASQASKDIDLDQLKKFVEAMAEINSMVAKNILSSTIGAIGAVGSAITALGLDISARVLADTARQSKDIDMEALKKFVEAMAEINSMVAKNIISSTFSALSGIGSAITAIGLKVAAEHLRDASNIARDITPEGMDKLKEVMQKLGEMGSPGGVMESLGRMFKAWFDSNTAGKLEQIVGTMQSIINKVNEINTEGVKEKVQSIVNVMSDISKIISEGGQGDKKGFDVSTQVQQIIRFMEQVVQAILSKVNDVYNAGAQIQGALWRGIQDRMKDMVGQGEHLVWSVINGVNNKKGEMYKAGNSVQGEFWRGIQDKFKDEYEQGRWLVQQVINGANSKSGEAYNAGSAVGNGFANGIRGSIGSINSAVGALSSAAITRLKSLLGIHSPSKVFEDLGVNLGEGLAVGIIATQDLVTRAITGIRSVATTGMSLEMSTPQGYSASLLGNTATFGEDNRVENHIGTINIASEVDGENWLNKLTRQDEVTRTGLTVGN